MATVRNTGAAFFLKGKRLACKWQEERWLLQLRPRLGSYRLRNGKISKMVFGREKKHLHRCTGAGSDNKSFIFELLLAPHWK